MLGKGKRKARVLALFILYQRSKIGINLEGELLLKQEANLRNEAETYADNLIQTIWSNLSVVDKNIALYLKNWKQSRLSSTLNALLRVSAGELLLFPEVDGKVVINEALEICKSFVDPKAVKFSNGVLDALWKNCRKEAETQATAQ